MVIKAYYEMIVCNKCRVYPETITRRKLVERYF